MKKRILVLGAYGGVGKCLSRYLLTFLDFDLILAGRDIDKLKAFEEKLRIAFPHKTVASKILDAQNKESLIISFHGTDLVIVTATVPEYMGLIVECALETDTDVMDILVRGDVVAKLKSYEATIREKGRKIITQCGFHPGLVAPLMRSGKDFFDDYITARVAMAMDPVFEKAESAKEIFHELIMGKAQILKNGQWHLASPKDAIRFHFKDLFGQRTCYPLPMKEIHTMDTVVKGIKNVGVYVAGFGTFVDRFIFPLAMILGKINTNLGQHVGSTLFFNHIKKRMRDRPRVEMVLKAKGTKNGISKNLEITLISDNAFELTALCVIGCLKQYLNGALTKPGSYLMGQMVNEGELLGFLEIAGIKIKKTFT